jgi:hypothetical protein
VAMIGSCKTLVLYTFVKTWFKLRDYLFFPGNDQGVFHQIVSPISNSESTDFFFAIIYLMQVIMISFSTGKLKKNCFGQIRNLFSFSTAQTEKFCGKIREKNW